MSSTAAPPGSTAKQSKPSAAYVAPQPGPARPYPSLYQINTRVLLTALSRDLGTEATLNEIPDTLLDRIATDGFDWVWFLGVWQTGSAGRQVSLANPDWQREFRELLPDFSDRDVCGSCFAIRSYSVHSDFGDNDAIQKLRQRIHNRGMRLLLDFVPNHVAPDHPWAREHPEYLVEGTEADIERAPQNYTRIDAPDGPRIVAYGRDPYFAGWPDTLQLNYANPALREAMISELASIAEICDGVRCDMAMLILPDVFERTWGMRPDAFWPDAIARTRARSPGFVFMAETYWDLEWELQQQGFDYTYDKRLYDRLREGHAGPVRDHFRADRDYQRKSVRFLENHDEPRAAAAFPPGTHQAAAILTFLCMGLRFIHQGQRQGLTSRIPVHLSRGPAESVNSDLEQFYDRLMGCLRHPSLQGEWRLLDCGEAWEGNWTSDCYIGFSWSSAENPSLIVAVNYAPNQSQAYLRIPADLLDGKTFRLRDLMSAAVYDRDGEDLRGSGLYLDLPPWGYHVFEMTSE